MLESIGILNLGTYIIGTIFIILVPGPNSIYVLKCSASFGYKKAYRAIVGVVIGDAILIFLSFLGIASIINASPILFTAVRYLGAAYLLYLGGKLIYQTFANHSKSNEPAEIKLENTFKKSLILSLTNPKAILFYVSFFIQFIDYSYPHTELAYLVLALILEFVSVCYLSFLVFFGVFIAHYFKEKTWAQKIGNSFIGLFFILFAAKLSIFSE